MAWVGASLNQRNALSFAQGYLGFQHIVFFTITHGAKGFTVQPIVRTLVRMPWQSINRYPEQWIIYSLY